MEYANPVFPNVAAANTKANVAAAQTKANVAPAVKTAAVKSANAPMVASYSGCHHGGYSSNLGMILVLFILLVIISRVWSY